ncbi:DUF1963 domain-containing protein [Sphingomicrobium sp. XHP0239]|uniref:DUF1963 domain-containing protein n=1 Tax=Sphingomicrobium maritimum TaxID=3133972 RepID=UPI0031CC7808
MFKNFLGLNKKAGTTHEDTTDAAQSPAIDPAQDRLHRLASRGQSAAAKEKFAKAPPLRKHAPSAAASREDRSVDESSDQDPPPTPVSVEDYDPDNPPAPNEVHGLLDTLQSKLRDDTILVPETDTETVATNEALAFESPDAEAPPNRTGPHPSLVKARAQAIMFRQHLPPRRSPTELSFWGGRPVLPDGFDWPTFTTREGETRALSFIGQIDLSKIPAAAGFHLLPDHGVLAVFLDLHWGAYWEWKIVHGTGFPPDFVEHDVPASLPRAFADPGVWTATGNWPRTLPRWTFDPVVIRASEAATPETNKFWPGGIDRTTATAAIADLESGLVATDYEPTRDPRGALEQPFGIFPQDWQAIRLALAQLEDVEGGTKKARKALTGDLSDWQRKVERADKAGRPLSKTARADFWRMLKAHDALVEPRLATIVTDSVEATLGSGDPSDLPPEAIALVIDRHRFSAGDERMLCAPTFVSMEAEERADEWLLLLEMGANPGLGHHFAEGVYQFWIRPEDLATGNFDAVELTAESY